FPYKKLKTGIKQPDFSSGLFNAYFYIKVKIYFWVNSSLLSKHLGKIRIGLTRDGIICYIMGNGQLNGVWKGYFYMQFIPYLLGLIMIVNIILALTVIFLVRKDASSTWSLLMVLFFISIAGFILYLIFGRKLSRQRIFTWDTKSRLGVKKEVQSQLRSIEERTFTFKHDNLIDYKDL